MFKKLIRVGAFLVIFCLLFGVPAACTRPDADDQDRIDELEEEVEKLDEELDEEINTDPVFIGISMPSDHPRWVSDGEMMNELLEDEGYSVDLQNAENDVALQYSQIEAMIEQGCQVLIIAPVDGYSLSGILDEAKDKEITVISFDRLMLGTDAVSYYVTFDRYGVGVMQGEYIEEALDLGSTDGPYKLEIFAGAPDDPAAVVYFEGAMSVLEPYIEDGILQVVSGETEFDQVAIDEWKPVNAQSRMDSLLLDYYSVDPRLDAILSANDSLAYGISCALENAGYTPGVDWPIITGQDCMIENIKNIIAGKQSMSILQDTRTLVIQTVSMVIEVVDGDKVTVNDKITYKNNDEIVPTYKCDTKMVDINTYMEVLIDSGYYLEEWLQ